MGKQFKVASFTTGYTTYLGGSYKAGSTMLMQNIYIDMDGTLKLLPFEGKGVWRFDGQFFYKKRDSQ